ncbi:MAG: hypothetical protein AB7U63_09230 [Porticoccaceae bacterium]|jgi:hypothetical protein
MLQISLINDCPQQPGRLLQLSNHQDRLSNPTLGRATRQPRLLNTSALPAAYETLVVRSPEDSPTLGIAKDDLLIIDKVRRCDDGTWIVTDSNHRLKMVTADNPIRAHINRATKPYGHNQGLFKEEYQFLGSLVEALPGAKGLRYAHNVKPLIGKMANGRGFSR